MSEALQQILSGLQSLTKKPLPARLVERQNVISNAVGVVYTIFKHYYLNLANGLIPPSVVIGGFPLPSVQELSGTLSDRVVKYRATGGVFLAHQDGGNEAVRIVGKAFGPNRFMFLNVLQFLFIYGSARSVDYRKDLRQDLMENIELADGLKDRTKNAWTRFEITAPDEGYEDAHMTFPVITKNRIYLSMYIETYTYAQSIQLGQQCITYSIFFRKYEGAPTYQYGYFIDKRTGQKLYYYRESEEKRSFFKSLLSIGLEFALSFLVGYMFQYGIGFDGLWKYKMFTNNDPKLAAKSYMYELQKNAIGEHYG